MGGKPSRSTPKDQRLKTNKTVATKSMPKSMPKRPPMSSGRGR